ncbi:hypothetical protein [Herbidospora mongoliensis]|uniref:hypothetical protein n=1 Tax=Herbidospora mongoliensis TaxID=688067 RepID=UPI00082FE0ED|nr:hypothetical protein [Herbidospora mongoliensis]
MTSPNDHLTELLRRLDDPEWPEWPKGYDRHATGALFERLVARLKAGFGASCPAERDTQDSSEYGRVEVPAHATVCGERIVVSVSKFGSLAFVAADNPGAFLGTREARDEGALDAGDLAKVERALTELGYVVVPEELLTSDYDGPTAVRSGRPSWWDRYFGTF